MKLIGCDLKIAELGFYRINLICTCLTKVFQELMVKLDE
jgi:hypothetical protein